MIRIRIAIILDSQNFHLCRIWTERTSTGEESESNTLEATGGMMATAMVAAGEVVVG